MAFDILQTESEGDVTFLIDSLGLREKQQFVRFSAFLCHYLIKEVFGSFFVLLDKL